MSPERAADRDYQRVLADKAEKLETLRKLKPGQPGYKRSLRAFLEADAAAERAMLKRIGRGPDEPDLRA